MLTTPQELEKQMKRVGVPKYLWDLPPVALRALLGSYSIDVDMDVVIAWVNSR